MGLQGVGVGARNDNGDPHPWRMIPAHKEKAGRTREEKKNDERKQKRIVLVFSLFFIP